MGLKIRQVWPYLHKKIWGILIIFSVNRKAGRLKKKSHRTKENAFLDIGYHEQKDCMMNRKIAGDPERSGCSGPGIKTGKQPQKRLRTLTYTVFCLQLFEGLFLILFAKWPFLFATLADFCKHVCSKHNWALGVRNYKCDVFRKFQKSKKKTAYPQKTLILRCFSTSSPGIEPGASA